MTDVKLRLGGHRGMGCTDHDFYQDLRDVKSLPAENTLESVVQAFKHGADYVEIDTVMSSDGVVFTTHRVTPEHHFFDTANTPRDMLNRMPFDAIRACKTGRYQNGTIEPLRETLDAIAAHDPKTADWAVVIEIVGVMETDQPYETNDFLARIVQAVAESKLDAERVLFSSFCLNNLLAMSHRMPHSRYGMLFAEHGNESPFYSDHRDGDVRFRHIPFQRERIADVRDIWAREAHQDAVLGYAHPEVQTVTNELLRACAEQDFAVNIWSYLEAMDEERLALYHAMARQAEELEVPFTVITDYLDAFRAD